MAHGPKSKKRAAARTRKANRMAQAAGFTGARHLLTLAMFPADLVPAAMAAIQAGY